MRRRPPIVAWLVVAVACSAGCGGCGAGAGAGAAARAVPAHTPAGAATTGTGAPSAPAPTGEAAAYDIVVDLPRAVSAASAAADPRTAPTRLLLFGDSGTGSDDQLQVAAAMATHCRTAGCDAAVLLGDIVYPDGLARPDDPLAVERFEAPYRGLGAPIWLVLGNHDYHGDPTAWVARYAANGSRAGAYPAHLPAQFYTVALGRVRLVVLDTNRLDDAQGSWLDAVLAEAAGRGDRWIVAAGHHPWRSYGMHRHAEPEMAAFFAKHLCGKVDLYVAGHDHDKQLLRAICGVSLVVSGAGGKLRPVGSGEETLFARSSLGWARLEVSDAEAKLTFHDARGGAEHRTLLRRTPKGVGSSPASPSPAN